MSKEENARDIKNYGDFEQEGLASAVCQSAYSTS